MQIYEPFTEKPGPGAIFDKKIYFKMRWDHGKKFYKRLIYESVDDGSLS